MSKCELAVCMPAYNAEKHIVSSVGSILSQTYTDFVFIITDDCSEDATARIVNDIHDNRILFFQNEYNLGAIETRNRMLEYCLANGFKYMAIMDADDIAYPDRLMKQVRILATDPALAICGSSMKIERTNGIWVAPETPDLVKAECVFGNAIPTSTATVRLRYFKQFDLKWNKDFAPCADYHLWYKMLFVHGLRAKNTGDVDMLYSYSPCGISHGKGLNAQEMQDARVKQLILSHFSISATFEEVKGFMKIALHRSNSIEDAEGFRKIASQMILNVSDCPVYYRHLKAGIKNRAEAYLVKVADLPKSVREQFKESGLSKSKVEALVDAIEYHLRRFKSDFLDVRTPNLSFFLISKYYKVKNSLKNMFIFWQKGAW